MRFLSCLVLASTALLTACPPATPAGCDQSGCPSGQSCNNGTCGPANAGGDGGAGLVYCDSDAECTADESCNTAVHACISRHDCDSPADCQDGQECRDFDGDGFRDCGFPGCQSDEECVDPSHPCTGGDLARCVSRACQCVSPCGGTCATGQLCCGTQAMCVMDLGPCGGMMCPPGQTGMGTSATGWNVAVCEYGGVMCGCAELPPLPLGEIGNPSAVDVDGTNKLWVAAYNKTYGDLMLGKYKGGGNVEWRFIDGVPVGGTITAGPSGPRGGVATPGPDVGAYLDIAVSSAGVAHIAYQDSSAGSLKYARVDGENITRLTLDLQPETGVYPSIALDPTTGAPRVAWLTRRDASGATPMGRVKLAAALSATPGAGSDFVTHVLKEQDLQRVPCEGGCATGFACQDVLAPGLDVCLPVQTNCSPACSGTSGQFCSGGQCLDLVAGSNTLNVPQGPGMWPSLVIRPDGRAVVVAYDSFGSRLLAWTPQGGDPLESQSAHFDEVVLAGAMDDAGEWPAVAVDGSGTVHVVYLHGTTHALVHLELGATLQVTSEVTVDSGERNIGMASDIHRLAEPAVVVRTDGTAVVAYQDATTGELFLATQSPSGFTRLPLAGGGVGQSYDGFYGFSTDAVAQGNNAPIISTFKFNVDPGQDSRLVFFNAN